MPRRVAAFVYAIGSREQPGQVKIGCTAGTTEKETTAKITSRYRTVYREVNLYQLIPVALPKLLAEDILKDRLINYHRQGELYDLPCETVEDTGHLLSLVYGDLEVPFAEAHFVEVLDPKEHKRQIWRERRKVEEQAAQEVQSKRQRTEQIRAEGKRALQELAARKGRRKDLCQPPIDEWAAQHIAVGNVDDHITQSGIIRRFRDETRSTAQNSELNKVLHTCIPGKFRDMRWDNGKRTNIRSAYWGVIWAL